MSGNPSSNRKVILLRPRGFCAGVVRAIDVVKIALELYGAPIYVRKEIVHNRHVVEELRELGAIFVNELHEVPDGSRAIFSAHGVSPAVRKAALERDLKVVDATCPLVTKVHLEAVKFARLGFTILLIGHRDHEEIEGTFGEAPSSTFIIETEQDAEKVQVPDPSKVCYLTQTTLSLDETRGIIEVLNRRFPQMTGPKSQDICYATENRQMAVKAVVPMCELLLVVGSQNSSNSKRLVEVCQNNGVPAYLLDDKSYLKDEWFDGVETVSVTAGASAPEHLVQELVEALVGRGYRTVEEVDIIEEDVRFQLPGELQGAGVRLTTISTTVA
ncbi:MAG: 4-hydroxy-3-methylbut-2-enyl diphosphate reductase [Bryobacteraceae bacterium]|nr:4-hydroxy-3-methylbut-2-enyl diphosphate reductase [Bryobacteraceae bacterium]